MRRAFPRRRPDPGPPVAEDQARLFAAEEVRPAPKQYAGPPLGPVFETAELALRHPPDPTRPPQAELAPSPSVADMSPEEYADRTLAEWERGRDAAICEQAVARHAGRRSANGEEPAEEWEPPTPEEIEDARQEELANLAPDPEPDPDPDPTPLLAEEAEAPAREEEHGPRPPTLTPEEWADLCAERARLRPDYERRCRDGRPTRDLCPEANWREGYHHLALHTMARWGIPWRPPMPRTNRKTRARMKARRKERKP